MLIMITETFFADPALITKVIDGMVTESADGMLKQIRRLTVYIGDDGYYVDEPLSAFVERINATLAANAKVNRDAD